MRVQVDERGVFYFEAPSGTAPHFAYWMPATREERSHNTVSTKGLTACPWGPHLKLTRTFYMDRGCRCDECRTAQREYMRQYRQDRKETR